MTVPTVPLLIPSPLVDHPPALRTPSRRKAAVIPAIRTMHLSHALDPPVFIKHHPQAKPGHPNQHARQQITPDTTPIAAHHPQPRNPKHAHRNPPHDHQPNPAPRRKKRKHRPRHPMTPSLQPLPSPPPPKRMRHRLRIPRRMRRPRNLHPSNPTPTPHPRECPRPQSSTGFPSLNSEAHHLLTHTPTTPSYSTSIC